MKTTKIRKKLESQSYKSDIVVIKGLHTGKAKISARINERNYRLPAAGVTIYVKENFMIIPDYTLYVLPFSHVQYRLAIVSVHDHDYNFRSNPNVL